jgi:hypothetical protein
MISFRFGNKEIRTILWTIAGYFFAGVAAGILFSNLTWPYAGQSGVFGAYVLNQLPTASIASEKYMRYLIKYRVRGYIFLMLSGFLRVGNIFVSAAVIGFGFFAGAAAGITLLQYGIKGMGILLLIIFPQGICYTAAVLLMAVKIYMHKGRIWNPADKRVTEEYLLVCFFAFLFMASGILLETFVSPGIISLLL